MKWVCVQWENRTAYDTFNEDTFEGPTNVPRDLEEFDTEEAAEKFYESNRPSKFFGSPAMYWGHPRECNAMEIADIRADIKKYGDL